MDLSVLARKRESRVGQGDPSSRRRIISGHRHPPNKGWPENGASLNSTGRHGGRRDDRGSTDPDGNSFRTVAAADAVSSARGSAGRTRRSHAACDCRDGSCVIKEVGYGTCSISNSASSPTLTPAAPRHLLADAQRQATRTGGHNLRLVFRTVDRASDAHLLQSAQRDDVLARDVGDCQTALALPSLVTNGRTEFHGTSQHRSHLTTALIQSLIELITPGARPGAVSSSALRPV